MRGRLIALLDVKDVGRPAARAAVDTSKRDHDLLIPLTAFSESIVAPYRRSHRDGQRAEAALAALGSLVDVTRDRKSGRSAPCDAADNAAGCAHPCDRAAVGG